MITIYLLWVLIGGEVKNVDAFMTKAECDNAKTEVLARVESLKGRVSPDKKEEVNSVKIAGCYPTQVNQPKMS